MTTSNNTPADNAAETMPVEVFFRLHRPLPNTLNPDAPHDGCMFETYGEELAHVIAADPRNVWTLTEEDGAEFLKRGFHIVNRLGYFLTGEDATGTAADDAPKTSYLATFRAPTHFAECRIEARTAEEALRQAKAMHEDDPLSLDWQDYEFEPDQLDGIEVGAIDRDCASWESDERRLRDAAPELLAALELCEAVLSELARLDDGTPSISALNLARAAIRKAKGGI